MINLIGDTAVVSVTIDLEGEFDGHPIGGKRPQYRGISDERASEYLQLMESIGIKDLARGNQGGLNSIHFYLALFNK